VRDALCSVCELLELAFVSHALFPTAPGGTVGRNTDLKPANFLIVERKPHGPPPPVPSREAAEEAAAIEVAVIGDLGPGHTHVASDKDFDIRGRYICTTRCYLAPESAAGVYRALRAAAAAAAKGIKDTLHRHNCRLLPGLQRRVPPPAHVHD
jgi:hypothetical protein